MHDAIIHDIGIAVGYVPYLRADSARKPSYKNDSFSRCTRKAFRLHCLV